MPPNNLPAPSWDSLKKWVVGLSSVLVVVPALINSGIDVYKAALNVPRTDAEHANVKLFQKYWNKPPVATLPVPVKHKGATYEAKFSIFDEGDIYIEFGPFTQWFPFPEPAATKKAAGWSPISSAYAQSQDLSRVYGPFRQQDTAQGYMLYRQRVYESGAVENFVIDKRTGAVVNYGVTQPPANAPQNRNWVAPFAGIDLDRQLVSPQANQPLSTMCVTPIGNCAMIQAGPRGVPCFCPTFQGPVSGMSN
jgi:hypothetical protein